MSLLESTANFIGKDGFNWWIGQVEADGGKDTEADELAANRVKVRILGYHNKNKEVLPTKKLPWATVMMPATSPQKSGVGAVHQLLKNTWVIGFFMDGSAAQIPIVMGSIGDHNYTEYKKDEEPTQGEKGEGFEQKAAPKAEDHDGQNKPAGEQGPKGGTGSMPANTSKVKGPSELDKLADKKKCFELDISNGKCGTETATKVEGPLKELFAFARGLEQSETGQFINSVTGEIEDLEGEISKTAGRLQQSMSGLLGGIKGTVLKETQKFIREQMDKINIPNPEILEPVKTQLKGIGDLVGCLFKQILGDLGSFIENLITDLVSKVLDTALCLIQDILGSIMSKIMDMVNKALGILQGVLGAIKGAAGMIQGLLSKVLDFIDLFCDGAVSCAIGASVFKTCQGAEAKGNEKSKKEQDQYKVKPPKGGSVIGSGKPNAKGFVPLELADGTKVAFNTSTGEQSPLDTATSGNKTGITDKSFDTRGPLDKFEDFVADLQPQVPVDCSNSLFNKKPCFPEMIFDALQSTTPIKALPIIDDIGSTVGVIVKKFGGGIPNFGLGVKARSVSTCNEQEGKGARFKPVFVADGSGIPGNVRLERVDVIRPGIGYGFSSDNSVCPQEQTFVNINDPGLKAFISEGTILYLVRAADGAVSDTQPDIMQVDDFDYKGEGLIRIATINPEDADLIQPGMVLRTAEGYEFTLNFTKKYIDFFIPPDATAVYANCPDLIPLLKDVTVVNVGEGHTDPKVIVDTPGGTEEIGFVTTDTRGRLLKPTITKKSIGFNNPRIVDSTGGGAKIVPVYEFTGPKRIKELIALDQYIDCVGHPSIPEEELVGYVNGVPYYGPFHIHMGRKMTGATHTGTGQYIYDSQSESIGSSSTTTSTTVTTVTPTTQTSTTTPTTPTTTYTPTNNNPPSSGGGGSTPPPSSGGGGGGY